MPGCIPVNRLRIWVVVVGNEWSKHGRAQCCGTLPAMPAFFMGAASSCLTFRSLMAWEKQWNMVQWLGSYTHGETSR